MKNAISLFIICLSLMYLSCEKQIPTVEEPQLVPVPLSSCGPLEYIHSMFVINNECWGVNPPENGDLNKNSLLLQVYFRGDYKEHDRTLGIFENRQYSNSKNFILLYGIHEGDGLISDYRYLFNIDSTQAIKFNFNQDSTELKCIIKNLALDGGPKFPIPNIPDKVVINEGSFRVRLVR